MDIVFDGVSFNAGYAASQTLEQFTAHHQHQWPKLSEHQRNERLERAHQVLTEHSTASERLIFISPDEVKTTNNGSDSGGNVISFSIAEPGGDIGGSDTGEGEGGDNPESGPTVQKGRKGGRNQAEAV